MIISATLSKPTNETEALLGKPYEKIKIKAENAGGKTKYFAEFFTKKQVTHRHFSEQELEDFLIQNVGKTFRNCVQRTETQEITFLSNKKGRLTRIAKDLVQNSSSNANNKISNTISNKSNNKNYLIPEGIPVPFLVLLGVMTPEGKIISSKYDKFRQINRFLEFIDDIIPEVQSLKTSSVEVDDPIRIADFGCGKSYLTFAVHYYLTELKHIPCEIEGLDLKEDVISYCNEITQKLGLKNLVFHTGDIASYSNTKNPDIVITLHACDTATDFALKYAVEHKAKAILSVPCCQHEVNKLLSEQKQLLSSESPFSSLLKWGIIKEKFSSLVTDALRGEWLEAQNYKVQMLEFIDIEHTPKNILIRAVKKSNKGNSQKYDDEPALLKNLGITPQIFSTHQ